MNTSRKIYTSNKAVLRTKLTKIIRDGPTSLKIVTDFDATLSKPISPSSYGVLERCPFLGDSYRQTCDALFQKYHPYEISSVLSHEEKCTYMMEWQSKAAEALSNERVSRKLYHQLLHHAQQTIVLRDGSSELFALTHKLQVPTLVFSAGVGDVIDSILLHHFSQFYQPSNPFYPIDKLTTEAQGHLEASNDYQRQRETDYSHEEVHEVLPPKAMESKVAHNFGVVPGVPRNIYVIANHLHFQSAVSDETHTAAELNSNTVKRFDPSTYKDDDFICGFYGSEAIHVFNKHEEVIKTSDYYASEIAPRTNTLLLGDSLGDALMVAAEDEDGTNKVCLRIAFLNTSSSRTVESHLQAYLAKFDIVFADNDGGFGMCNEILKQLSNEPSSLDAYIAEAVEVANRKA